MLQYMGGQIVRINVHSMQLRQRALSKARWVEIRSSRMEIRLDTIGLLLAKPKAQNFETRRLNSTPTAKSRKKKVYSRGAEFQ
jgi:hypothetical protein